MIDHHAMLFEMNERRRALLEEAEACRLAAVARAHRPHTSPVAALRRSAGLGLARLGLWLAGPPPARTPCRQAR
jgi:hypothetical protein